MNKKKFLILIVLTIFCVGMCLSSASATKTKHVTFSKIKNIKSGQCPPSKRIGNKDWIGIDYHTQYSGQCGGKNHLHIVGWNEYDGPYLLSHKFIKAKVWYKHNSKRIVKSYKIKKKKYGYAEGICVKLSKGYIPYKAVVYYK